MWYLGKRLDSGTSARRFDPTPRAALFIPIRYGSQAVAKVIQPRAEILFAETAHVFLENTDRPGFVGLDVMNRFDIALHNAQHGAAIGFNFSLGGAQDVHPLP